MSVPSASTDSYVAVQPTALPAVAAPAAAPASAPKERTLNEMLHLGEGRIVVKFSDTSEIYDVATLRELSFFKFLANENKKAKYAEDETQCLLLEHMDHATFRIVVALLIEKKSVHQAITKADLVKNPALVESLAQAMNFLAPIEEKENQKENENEKRLDAVRESLTALINIEWATAIVRAPIGNDSGANLGTNPAGQGLEPAESSSSSSSSSCLSSSSSASSSSASSSSTQSAKDPFCLARAKEVIARVKIFESLEDAEEHFDDWRDSQIRIERARDDIVRLETSLVRHKKDGPFIKATMVELAQHQKNVAFYIERIAACRKRVDINSLPIMVYQRLSAHTNDKDPLVRAMALQAQEKLVAYKESIMVALRACGADVSRQEMMEYLVGPKGYLFDHYGLRPDIQASGIFHFRHKKYPQFQGLFGYSLTNNSLYDLEDEIRNDFTNRKIPLPARVVTQRVITKLQSTQVQELRKRILPVLQNWVNESLLAKRGAKRELLKQWNWTDKIEVDDIGLRNCSQVRLEDEKVWVIFRNFGRAIVLNLVDCNSVYKEDFNTVRELPAFEGLQENGWDNEYTHLDSSGDRFH